MAIASLGAMLGIINTVTSRRRGIRRVAIRYTLDKGSWSGDPRLWCEVINPGSVPVVIAEVTMIVDVKGVAEAIPIHGDAEAEAKMLGDLRPGTSTRTAASAIYEPYLGLVRDIYVQTQCGKVAWVDDRMLRNTQAQLRSSLKVAGLDWHEPIKKPNA